MNSTSLNQNPSIELREVLSTIIIDPQYQKNQSEIDCKIITLCKEVLQTLSTQPLDEGDGFLLLRNMCEFMKARIEGFQEGKSAIRECYDRIYRILPNFQTIELKESAIQILQKSYPCNFDISAFLQLFHERNKSGDLPSSVFSYLIHLDQLDEPMRKKLYAVLAGSGNQINEYFVLIGKALQLNNDLGLTHRHLLDPSEEDTVGYSDDESSDIAMVVDYQLELQILDCLSQESDGGYLLLKKAEFLSIGGVNDLLVCVKGLKNNFSTALDLNHPTDLLNIYLQIHPRDRADVLMDVLEVRERWNLDSAHEKIKHDILTGIAAIPPELRETVLALLPTFNSYINLSKILDQHSLREAVNGIIAAYVLFPYLQAQRSFDVEDWRKILTSILWEKLLDHSLPVFTLTALAHFVRTIGLPGYHPIRMLGQIMRTASPNEPERSCWIHDKLEEHFTHLSSFQCPLTEVLTLNKRKAEDLEIEGGPVQKKQHLG